MGEEHGAAVLGSEDENGTGKTAEQQERRGLPLRMFKKKRNLCCAQGLHSSGLLHRGTSCTFINNLVRVLYSTPS